MKPPTPTISLFGSEISGSNTTSNFVTDINFKTEVTPDLATQITVGATAGGSATKNYDATPFSNWNKGLIDRQNPSFQDTPGYEEEDDDLSAINAAWEAGNEVGNITKFINIRISGNLDQISDNEVNKNVKFEGITFPNVEYSTFVSLAKGYLYAKNVFKQVVEVLPTTIVGNFLDSLLYDEAKQYDNNFQLYLVRAFGGKINIKTDKGNTKSVPIKIKNALYTQLSDDFVSEGHQSFKGYVNLNNQQLFGAFLGQVAGTFRVPGSGSTSDREFAAFQGAIGNLANQPEGQYLNMYFVRKNFERERKANEIRATMMKGGYSEAEIGEEINKELSKPIGVLVPAKYKGDPDGFKEWYKSQPDGTVITNVDADGIPIIEDVPTIHVVGMRVFEED